MYKKKHGFTLAEVLLSMTIIGIVMALSVQTIKVVKASYTSLTYFTFENIKGMITAVYSGSLPEAVAGKSGIINLDTNGNVYSLDEATTTCKLTTGKLATVLKGVQVTSTDGGTPYCHAMTGNQSPIFCQSIAAISNTSGAIYCSDTYPVKMISGEPFVDADYSFDLPNFKTTNGQKYYISNWTYNANVSSKFGFRVMAVDVNGDAKPNINVQKGKQYPDVVTFVILDNGEIYPVGVAADNITIGSKKMNYLSSRVKGYYYEYKAERTENVPPECNIVGKDNGVTLVNKRTCNYGVVIMGNDQEKSTIAGKENTALRVFSYRQAFCTSLGSNPSPDYDNYCASVTISDKAKYCPPSTDKSAFDLCTVETIKPMFRYNLR